MIPMNDFRAEPLELRERELAAAKRVIESGWYVLGREVENFEVEWAQKCGVPEAVGVGNGMDAIEIGLRALSLGPGDEVITTPMTAFATVLAILRAGATPVLADIEPATALLSRASVERCLAKRTKAVLLVHLYGQIHDMDVWEAFCANHQVLLLEDCAQSHLAKWNNRVAGSFGAFGAYSFYPTKNLGAIGDGGAIVTKDRALAARARMIRNYGQSQRYHHPLIGLNSRLDELQAGILRERLSWLDRYTQRRREIAELYFNHIDNRKVHTLARATQPDSHVYHLFVVTCEEREQLSDHLSQAGVGCLSHYPIAVHQQEPCRDLLADPQGLASTEKHARQCLSLPCHPQLTDQQVQRVIEAVNDFN